MRNLSICLVLLTAFELIITPTARAQDRSIDYSVGILSGFMSLSDRDEALPFGIQAGYSWNENLEFSLQAIFLGSTVTSPNALGGDSACTGSCVSKLDQNVQIGTVGLNFKSSFYEVYVGPRIGIAHLRDSHLTIGANAGREWLLTDSFSIGAEATYLYAFGQPQGMSAVSLLGFINYRNSLSF